MSVQTPRRQLIRPRTSQTKLNSGFATASTPNLAGAYSNSAAPPLPAGASLKVAGLVTRKGSLSALTHGSLATIPDASESYGLSTVLDEDYQSERSPSPRKMAGYSGNPGDVEVGDIVDVPGNMHGTVKFLGGIPGKNGVFAGVELSQEYASRGKNNGEVDGVQYFRTSIPGSGIFLPIARALPRGQTSNTPSRAPSQLGRPGYSFTPPTPNFSQSVGPGRAASPYGKKTRPSLPRPESPARRQALTPGPVRPVIGSMRSTPQPPNRFNSPTPSKFGQSVRGTRDTGGDPPKKLAFTPRSNFKASVGPRSNSALGGAPLNYSDDETTPIGIHRSKTTNESLGSTASFNAKMRPLETKAKEQEEELQRLRTQLEERDKQLREQASSLAEMENSLNEVQSLMSGSDAGGMRRGSSDDRDTSQLRTLLREKNEKIQQLTAEFDNHRADFRSTIDTLEMASTETERVYEQRVEELMNQIHEYQERSEDVHSVAAQLKQLEELVQELEEGLEDARRGESEARGEVEFLRGEVERGRAELRREREKAAEMLAANAHQNENSTTAKEVAQRDDEIRSLKAIIHSLSQDQEQNSHDRQRTSMEAQKATEALESEIDELRRALETKINREEELERELEALRRSSMQGLNQRASAMTIGSTRSNGTAATERPDRPLPERPLPERPTSVPSWRDRQSSSPELQRRNKGLAGVPESDNCSNATTDSTLWCEICETGGHDILTCTMFGGENAEANRNGARTSSNSQLPPSLRTGRDAVTGGLKPLSPGMADSTFRPAPLSPAKAKKPAAPPVAIIPNPSIDGPVAGKESGVIDTNKWCALCERDGHESVDCPFEDAF